jgi:hypothetical protein
VVPEVLEPHELLVVHDFLVVPGLLLVLEVLDILVVLFHPEDQLVMDPDYLLVQEALEVQ